MNPTTSEHTKQQLCAQLKKLMAREPLEKITIRAITEGCGLNRQAFYYHFEDIYDLVRWMFEEEALSLLRQHEGVLLWQEGLLQLLRYVEENRAVCLCALNSMGREHMHRLFQEDIHAIIHRTVDELDSACRTGESPAEKDMVTHLYVCALAGVVESWTQGEIHCSAETLVSFADRILQDHLRGAALRVWQAENGK